MVGDAADWGFRQAFGVLVVLTHELGTGTSHRRSLRASGEIFGLFHSLIYFHGGNKSRNKCCLAFKRAREAGESGYEVSGASATRPSFAVQTCPGAGIFYPRRHDAMLAGSKKAALSLCSFLLLRWKRSCAGGV